jgi:predicted SprT family Zn-dependent metalloprotease
MDSMDCGSVANRANKGLKMSVKTSKLHHYEYTCFNCGHIVTSMKGCKKKGPRYFCKKCGNNVTKIKLEQLVTMIRKA